MDMGTPTTERLVQMVLTDLPKVVIDYPNARNRNNCDTGGFQLVYRAPYEVSRPQAVNLSNFQIEGKQISIKKQRQPKNHGDNPPKKHIAPVLKKPQPPPVPKKQVAPVDFSFKKAEQPLISQEV